jgi:hypothetical protein
MLGPEQVNFPVRPTPIFLEGVVPIHISEEVARDLGLRDGQIVRAVVGMREEELRLTINNRELAGLAGNQLKVGETLDLRVSNNGRLLQPLVAASALPEVLASPGPRLLSLLFRPAGQSAVTQIFMPHGSNPGLQALVEGENARWLSQLIHSMARLSPISVKRALMASGLFTEGRLARSLPPNFDLKQLLKTILRSQSPQSLIAQDIESAVDEIESRQLESLQAQNNRSVSYTFHMPFSDANPVQVQFERGPRQGEESELDWVINLHTDSGTMGELWLKTTFKPSLRLDMEMWAARAEIAQLARSSSSQLDKQLQEFGLTLGKMTVHNANRPLGGTQELRPGGMVDVST